MPKAKADRSGLIEKSRCGRLRSLAIVCFTVGAVPAHAAWDVTPQIGTGLLWEDNARFESDDGSQQSETALVLNADLDLVWSTERSQASFEPRGWFTFYDGAENKDLEDENIFLPFGFNHRTQRSSLGFSAEWRDVSVRTSELADAIPDDPDAEPSDGQNLCRQGILVQTGDRCLLDDSQRLWRISPYWSYSLTRQDKLSANIGYTDASYDLPEDQTGRFPYDWMAGSLAYERLINQRNSISVALNASFFQSEDSIRMIQNDTDTYGLSLSYSRDLSDTLTVTVTGGASNSEFDVRQEPRIFGFGGLIILGCPEVVPSNFSVCTVEDDDSTFVGGIQLRKRAERTIFNFDIDRRISPNSNGLTVIRDNIRFFIDHDFNTRWRGRAGVNAYQQEDNGRDRSREVNYARFELSATRRFTEHWSVRARYDYTWIDNDLSTLGGSDSDKRTRHAVLLEVTYRGLRRMF